MRPSFLPRLVNEPVDDPAVYIPFLHQHRALLFDLGDISALPPKEIFKISHVFVTHAHMDHFYGFDRLARLFLGRDQTLHLFGPKGFLEHTAGKLAGYTWDLVRYYRSHFVIIATETREFQTATQQYSSRNGFRAEQSPTIRPFDGILLEEPALTIKAVELAHSTPCLGFRMEERFHINIRRERLTAMGLKPGPWLADFKRKLFRNPEADASITIAADNLAGGTDTHSLKKLADAICLITPGQIIAYISDAVYSPENRSRMIELARDADHLFIEAPFLHRDHHLALAKNHLTARQAGSIAAMAGAKQMTPFHFSPRYSGETDLLSFEAYTAFRSGGAAARPYGQ